MIFFARQAAHQATMILVSSSRKGRALNQTMGQATNMERPTDGNNGGGLPALKLVLGRQGHPTYSSLSVPTLANKTYSNSRDQRNGGRTLTKQSAYRCTSCITRLVQNVTKRQKLSQQIEQYSESINKAWAEPLTITSPLRFQHL